MLNCGGTGVDGADKHTHTSVSSLFALGHWTAQTALCFRESSFWWIMSFWIGNQSEWLSFCIKRKDWIRPPSETSWERGDMWTVDRQMCVCVCECGSDHVWCFREDMHLQILKAFVELHEFSDLNLVQALRWEHQLFFIHRRAAELVSFLFISFFLQAVLVEFPAAGWSSEDRPHDGGLCFAVLHL